MFIRISNISKIKAFTLLEILVALVLSFFIIGILYLTYNMMGRQFRSEYQKQLSSVVLLRSGLEMDFFKADSIIAEQKQIFVFRQGKESIYQFHEDAILRTKNSKSDTLFVGKCLTGFDMDDKSKWVSRLTLKIEVESQDIQMAFNKCYRPNQKLKQKEVRFEY